ncbi:hypothetical protein BOX15_Mlig011674g1, partial [Macrostomum lignano]
ARHSTMVYNYTKPRGPIAAMYSSPGPKYMLPSLVGQPHHDPRSVHNRGPAYPFGLRHGKFKDESSPGPCYLPLTYRDGKDGSPHYSLYGRPKDGTLFSAPGPGAYKPESTNKEVYSRAPAYSFGLRHHQFRTDNTPGPNAYTPDPMLGKTLRSEKKAAPSYTLVGRSKVGGFHEDLQKTPGPGAYSVVPAGRYRHNPPAYSLTSRNSMPGDSTTKPGPGAHSPETNFYRMKRAAPAFSFGIRHSQYKGEFITDADME